MQPAGGHVNLADAAVAHVREIEVPCVIGDQAIGRRDERLARELALGRAARRSGADMGGNLFGLRIPSQDAMAKESGDVKLAARTLGDGTNALLHQGRGGSHLAPSRRVPPPETGQQRIDHKQRSALEYEQAHRLSKAGRGRTQVFQLAGIEVDRPDSPAGGLGEVENPSGGVECQRARCKETLPASRHRSRQEVDAAIAPNRRHTARLRVHPPHTVVTDIGNVEVAVRINGEAGDTRQPRLCGLLAVAELAGAGNDRQRPGSYGLGLPRSGVNRRIGGTPRNRRNGNHAT
jgi:hypothetical protein